MVNSSDHPADSFRMSLSRHLHYYQRIFSAYLLPGTSHLSFWHETPEANPNARPHQLGEYYMAFTAKADFAGDFDSQGIPLLDYHGKIGQQYNPIAISQYGLGNYNLFRRTGDLSRRKKFLAASDWLIANLEQNRQGVWVWNHHFNWEYRDVLNAPWHSGLAQGQGISLLLRAHRETSDDRYRVAAYRAFQTFHRSTEEGGVIFTDGLGDIWIEEYVVHPPTHILNGFIWASWGIYDYLLATGDEAARRLFEKFVETLAKNIDRYDIGFWSLYEQSGTRLKMVASPFYHRLHIVQLQIMHQLTGNQVFQRYADRWQAYSESRVKRTAALCYKGVFKLCYY